MRTRGKEEERGEERNQKLRLRKRVGEGERAPIRSRELSVSRFPSLSGTMGTD